MLGSFMQEMQITPEQFEVACLEGRYNTGNGSNTNHGFSFHQGLFQQIWAANDIRIFIRMMTQRNVELQLQALDLIERKQNSDKESDTIPADILKATKILDDNKLNGEFDDDHFVDDDSQDRDLDTNEKVDEELNDKFEDNQSIDDKFKRLNLFFEREQINSADMKTRQEYLRSQRDKILEIKKKARTRQLNESVKKNGRPSSAQFAQKLMEGQIENVNSDPPEASMVLRKTLAKRLRTEVVDTEEN